MTAPEFIRALASHGVALSARDGRLHYRAPAGTSPELLRLALAIHRPALMAALTGRPVASDTAGVCWDPRGGVRVALPGEPGHDPAFWAVINPGNVPASADKTGRREAAGPGRQ